MPAAPVNGAAPGNGTQYNATSVYVTTSPTAAVLTDGYYLALPDPRLQAQSYTLLV